MLALLLLLSVGSTESTILPDWAAPAAIESSTPESPGPDIAYMPPMPGGAPAQVPVDGGLSLLALAGAGYAARRLRVRQ